MNGATFLARCRSKPDLAAPAMAILVFLDDQDAFLAEQDDVFVVEHASSSAPVPQLPVEGVLGYVETSGLYRSYGADSPNLGTLRT